MTAMSSHNYVCGQCVYWSFEKIGGSPLQNMPSKEQFKALSEELENILMDPKFPSVLADIQKLPPGERWQAASQLSLQALVDRGFKIPENLVITTETGQDAAVGFTLPGTGVNFYILFS
jgi:hypothetical protein